MAGHGTPSRLKIGGASPCQNFTWTRFVALGRPRHTAAQRLSKENLRSALHDVAAKVARDDRVAAQGQDVKPTRHKHEKCKHISNGRCLYCIPMHSSSQLSEIGGDMWFS